MIWKTITFDKQIDTFPKPIEFTFQSDDGILREGQCGFGKVKYAEGSVYTGSLIYSDGKYQKYGFGEQDFSDSSMSAADYTADENLVLWKFVGFYDYRETDWIFGNGILYFLNKKGKPAAFVKGYFAGNNKVCDWERDFTPSLLLPGFSPDMEIDSTPHAGRFVELQRAVEHSVKCDTVLIGDSWFHLYECPIENGCICGTFAEDTEGKNVLNLGIGGSTFYEWARYHGNLLKNVDFKRAIVNLGFNDVHCRMRTEDIVNNARTLFDTIRKCNSSAEIYLLNITPSVTFKLKLRDEKEASTALKALCDEYGITVLDSAELFMPNGKYIADFESYYYKDGLHLNRKGYLLWRQLFIDLL